VLFVITAAIQPAGNAAALTFILRAARANFARPAPFPA
jgi:hypothetical protein